MRTIFRRPIEAPPQALDPYDIAYLAGGPRQVAETALIALCDRGVVTARGHRVRAGEAAAGHPVERALIARCSRETYMSSLLADVAGGQETGEIAHRLVSYGLLTRYRHRLTHTGTEYLETAKEDATLPAYVLDGSAVHADPVLRRTLKDARPGPPRRSRVLVPRGRRSFDPDLGFDFFSGANDVGQHTGGHHHGGGGHDGGIGDYGGIGGYDGGG